MKNKRPTLLVVDDEPEVLQSVHDLFRLDYRVLTCDDGADALRILASPEDIHAILSDQRMPGMNGVDLLKNAKRLRPETTRLLFTAYADIKAVIDAINEGSVYRYIEKPWDAQELQSVVKQAVEKHDLIVERSQLLNELKESNQRLAEANRLKGAFIEVASHELNTPVTVMLGMTQLWRLTQAECATDAERNWIARIQSAGKRLASVVERMLKLVRTDELARPLDVQSTALAPLVASVLDQMSPFLEARRQRIELRLDPRLGEAEIDAAKIGDVLTNLLINAVKFTPDEGRISLSAQPMGTDRVLFEVTDQGIGIEPGTQPYVFEPFFTGFDTMHHSSGDFEYCKRGMGLGLCLVKRFVELHGGNVEVRSAPGAGSTFAFTLPRTQIGGKKPVNARAG
jgi:signal transduction histidine kinase